MAKDKKIEWKITDAESLVREALTLDYFHPLDAEENGTTETPIPAHFVPGQGGLVTIIGENASGKSFMRRILSLICRDVGIEAMHISMEGRGGSYGGLRGMIYGDESWQSTGVCSVGTVLSGINTCSKREGKHVIIWDEPDLGLSENGAAGMGKAIADYMANPNPLTVAAVVVTHSKPLVQQLAALNPHFLYLGAPTPEQTPQTLPEWLNRGIEPRSLEDIREAGHHRFQLIQKILNSIKKDT